MRRVDLAPAVGLTSSGVTRLLDGLEKAGLLRKEQCTSDLQVTYAAITDAGRAHLRCAADSHLESLAAIFADVSMVKPCARPPDAGFRMARRPKPRSRWPSCSASSCRAWRSCAW